MQFTKAFWPGLADGTITMTFRRWKRRQVVAGHRYRTPVGILEVDEVDVIAPGDVTDGDARRAGFADAAELVAELRGDPASPLYRVRFHRVHAADPREVLAAQAALSVDDVAEIARRLDGMDRASNHGPWTRQTLRLIASHPERRAPDLAAMAGRETQPFKRDVRKLKNLGLTVSMRIGYRLSPRGQAFVAAGAAD